MKKTGTVLITFTFIVACGVLAFALAARSSGNGGGGAGELSADAGAAQDANVSADASAAGRASQAAASADEKFMAEAALGGALEVELGRLAADRAASEEVKVFARRLVEDHTKAGEALARLASAKGAALPGVLDAKRRKEVENLSARSGESFDREFVKATVKLHKQDIAAYERESERGADAEVKAHAAAALPTLREHLKMAQRLHDKMLLRRNQKQ